MIMKLKTACISLFFLFFPIEGKPLIVATLMIKDEATLIRQTLEPLIDGGITDFLIFDTGSTDRTLEIVETLFCQHKECCAQIFQEPFIDYATSRNRALELAETIFPEAIFTLMLDAEWYMHGVDKLVSYCKKFANENSEAYVLRICTRANEFYLPLLMRCTHKLRYIGAVHEYVPITHAAQVSPEVFVEFRRSDKGQAATGNRWRNDKEILLRKLEKDSSDSHALFFLGQTYCCLNDFESAHDSFAACIPAALQEQNIERAYESAYRAALVIEEMIKKKKNYSWDLALKYYHRAFEICPDRAEPLVRVADHYYYDNNMDLCYKYALYASQLPLPCTVGYVEKYAYERGRYELLLGSASALGNKEVAQWALDKLQNKHFIEKS